MYRDNCVPHYGVTPVLLLFATAAAFFSELRFVFGRVVLGASLLYLLNGLPVVFQARDGLW